MSFQRHTGHLSLRQASRHLDIALAAPTLDACRDIAATVLAMQPASPVVLVAALLALVQSFFGTFRLHHSCADFLTLVAASYVPLINFVSYIDGFAVTGAGAASSRTWSSLWMLCRFCGLGL